MGSALIIDDADMLYHGSGHGTSDSDSFHDGVIDTIVANVSGKPGEDRCVILVGKKDRMKEMFLNSNPGLQRRFPIELEREIFELAGRAHPSSILNLLLVAHRVHQHIWFLPHFG